MTRAPSAAPSTPPASRSAKPSPAQRAPLRRKRPTIATLTMTATAMTAPAATRAARGLELHGQLEEHPIRGRCGSEPHGNAGGGEGGQGEDLADQADEETAQHCQDQDRQGGHVDGRDCFHRVSPSAILPDTLRAMLDAVVIGGGHNGLTAAAYLARAGLKTVLFERRELLGGACVTEELWPGFRVSRAAYVAGLLRPAMLRELRLHRTGTPAAGAKSLLLHADPRWTRSSAGAGSRGLPRRDPPLLATATPIASASTRTCSTAPPR